MRCRSLFSSVVLLAIGLALSSCGLYGPSGDQPVAIRRNQPVVYIYPMADTYDDASVGVLPFAVPENLDRTQGKRVAALFKDIFLGRRIFPRVVLLNGAGDAVEDSVAEGRRRGVDLLLVGRIDQMLEGTQFGGARLAMAVRLVNVHTGNTVWYIEHALDQPVDYPEESLLRRFVAAFRPPSVRPSQGPPAMPNMLARAASDVTEIISGSRTVPR